MSEYDLASITAEEEEEYPKACEMLKDLYPGKAHFILRADPKMILAIRTLRDIADMASRCPVSESGLAAGSPLRIMQRAEKTLSDLVWDYKPIGVATQGERGWIKQ